MKYDLNNKQFITTGNEHGLSGVGTVFHYFQSGEVISGEYRGGEIVEGRFVGKYTAPEQIELLFQCITRTGELLAGKSSGRISRHEDGKLALCFDWRWLYGDTGGGVSRYREC